MGVLFVSGRKAGGCNYCGVPFEKKNHHDSSVFACDHWHCHGSFCSSPVSSPIWTVRSPRCSLWYVVIPFQATAKWHNSFIPPSSAALGLPWGPQQLVSSPNENSSQVCVKPSGRSDQRHLIFFSQQQAWELCSWCNTQPPFHSPANTDRTNRKILGSTPVQISGLLLRIHSIKYLKDYFVLFHHNRARWIH